MRVFAAGIATETNVFSPMPTGLADYYVASPEDAGDTRADILAGTTFERFAKVVEERGGTYIQGTYAHALPAGITPRAAYEELRGRVLRELEAALPVDGVLLNLHGAMAAEGYRECETDLAEQIRRVAGDQARIGVLLDLHCDIEQSLIEATDVVITYKEYPHIDIDDRGEELARLITAAAAGEIDPRSAFFDCAMLGMYVTPLEPMRSFVDAMSAAEQRPGVLSVSLGHGFPWGDSAEMGARLLAVADGDQALAQSVADELGKQFYALREQVTLRPLSMKDGLDQALALVASGKTPIVVADMADNAGGGAPSDSTFVLRELLARGVRNAAVALFWDPSTVHQAFAAGEGAKLTVRLGGKLGPSSGDPLDLDVTVRGLVPDLVQHWPQTEGTMDIPCGPVACLTCEGIDIIVGGVRHQVFATDLLTEFGIDLADRDLIVVKSSNHFRAAWAPVAAEVLYMSAPGALSFEWETIGYELMPLDKYPLVADPLGLD
jgi:microcystin degradation protein MlrC